MGKWAQGGYERACADKMKTLFMRSHRVKGYDNEVERDFRAFVKSFDVDDRFIRLHFDRILQRQRELDEKAVKKEAAATARPRWYHPYPNHDESNERANGEANIEAGPSIRRGHLRPPSSMSGSDDDGEDISFPGLDPWATRSDAMANDAWHPAEDFDDWDNLGESYVGDYEGYNDVTLGRTGPLDPDAMFNNELDSSRPRPIARPIPISRSQSPPWSLSRERQRARNAEINPSRPGPQAAEPTYDPLPLFLPVGDTPLPVSAEDDFDEIILRSGATRNPYAAPSTRRDSPSASERPDWLQLARTEIDEESASNRSDDGPVDTSTRRLADTHLRVNLRRRSSGLLTRIHDVSPSTSVPPVHGTRRRRIHLEDTGVPQDAERRVRRRTASTSSGPATATRPLFLPPLRPTSASNMPSSLGGARMQRTRHSMPPAATLGGRDTRRDGVVIDYADLDLQRLGTSLRDD